MSSHDCQNKSSLLKRKNSNHTISATFMWIFPKSKPKKANCIFLPPLIGLQSLLMHSYHLKPQGLQQILFGVPYRCRQYKIYTILEDNCIQFINRKQNIIAFMTPFDRVCFRHAIEHRLTKVPPWTNGQVERMNRTIKETTVGRYHYGSHDELKKTPTYLPHGL